MGSPLSHSMAPLSVDNGSHFHGTVFVCGGCFSCLYNRPLNPVMSEPFYPFSLFKVISQQVSDKHLQEGRLYPPLNTIRDVSLKIAVKVRQAASRLPFLPPFATYEILLFPGLPGMHVHFRGLRETRSSDGLVNCILSPEDGNMGTIIEFFIHFSPVTYFTPFSQAPHSSPAILQIELFMEFP